MAKLADIVICIAAIMVAVPPPFGFWEAIKLRISDVGDEIAKVLKMKRAMERALQEPERESTTMLLTDIALYLENSGLGVRTQNLFAGEIPAHAQNHAIGLIETAGGPPEFVHEQNRRIAEKPGLQVNVRDPDYEIARQQDRSDPRSAHVSQSHDQRRALFERRADVVAFPARARRQ